MTENELKKRLIEIEDTLKKIQAQFNMLEGSKEEVKYWLSKLEEVNKKRVDNK